MVILRLKRGIIHAMQGTIVLARLRKGCKVASMIFITNLIHVKV
jgi:hypothetical protein